MAPYPVGGRGRARAGPHVFWTGHGGERSPATPRGQSGCSLRAAMLERGDGASTRHRGAEKPEQPTRHAGGGGEADRVALARLARGEAGAFAVLFRRYYDALCAFAEGLVESADDAEEVVSEVFVRIWEARERLDVRASLKSYLYAATRNVALNHLRRVGAEERTLGRASQQGALPGVSAPTDGGASDIHARELERAIDEAISNLPPRRREIFLLHRLHGLTYAEIAAALEIAPKTVENHLGLALKDLRTSLTSFLEE